MDIQATFDDGTVLLLPEDHPAMGWQRTPVDISDRDSLDADGKPPGTLVMVRAYHPNAARVWIWRDGQWSEAMFETFQQQIDRLTRERDEAIAQRDAARRLVKLHRIPLTAEEHAEMVALVAQAKREGWL